MADFKLLEESIHENSQRDMVSTVEKMATYNSSDDDSEG